MKIFVSEFIKYIAVIGCLIFLGSFYKRWEQSSKLSVGHKISGLVSMFCLLLFLTVVAFGPAFTLYFIPIMMLGLFVWVQYNNWYFACFPIPPDKYPPKAGLPDTFVPKSRVGRWLVGHEDVADAVWFEGGTKKLLNRAAIAFAFIYGFVRIANVVADSDKRVAALTNTVANKVVASNQATTEEVKNELKNSTATLQQGQNKILNAADSAKIAAKATNQAVKKTEAGLATLSKKTGQIGASVERSSRSAIILTPMKQSTPIFRLPNVKYKFPEQQTRPNGRKSALVDTTEKEPVDRTADVWALQGNNHKDDQP